VECWGADDVGELGYGTMMYSLTPITVNNITNANSISAGMYNTCALLGSGKVQCWGPNSSGELGIGTQTNDVTLGLSPPATVTGVTNAVGLFAGSSTTCAQLKTGTLQCWGANASGQLGISNMTYSTIPVAVNGVTDVIMAAANTHACAVLRSGTIQCWGENGYGQLGNGTTTSTSTPVTVLGL